MSVYLGIDPGLSGAIALVNDDGRLVMVEDMPTTARGNGRVRHEVDAGGIAHLLRSHAAAGHVWNRRVGRSPAWSRRGEHVLVGPFLRRGDVRSVMPWYPLRAAAVGEVEAACRTARGQVPYAGRCATSVAGRPADPRQRPWPRGGPVFGSAGDEAASWALSLEMEGLTPLGAAVRERECQPGFNQPNLNFRAFAACLSPRKARATRLRERPQIQPAASTP